MADSSKTAPFPPIKVIGVAPPNGYPLYTLSPEPGGDEAEALWGFIESIVRSQSGAKRNTIVDRRFEILATCRPYSKDARHHNPSLLEESSLLLHEAVYRQIFNHNYRTCDCGKHEIGELVGDHLKFHSTVHKVICRDLKKDLYVINGGHEAKNIGEIFGFELKEVSRPIMHVGGTLEILENRSSLILPDCCLSKFHKYYD